MRITNPTTDTNKILGAIISKRTIKKSNGDSYTNNLRIKKPKPKKKWGRKYRSCEK